MLQTLSLAFLLFFFIGPLHMNIYNLTRRNKKTPNGIKYFGSETKLQRVQTPKIASQTNIDTDIIQKQTRNINTRDFHVGVDVF